MKTSTTITNIETVYEGWAKYHIATVKTAGGAEIRREFEDHGSAVCVLAYDASRRKAMFVRQLRVPVLVASGEDSLLEVIAGLIDDDNEPLETARREAMEEAGLRLNTLEHVATVWPMPGLSTETIALFIAEYTSADRVGPGGGLPEEHEEVEPVELSLIDLMGWADRGELRDLKSLALLQTLRLRRPELFKI